MSVHLITGEDSFLAHRTRDALRRRWLADAEDAGLHSLLYRELHQPSVTTLTDALYAQSFTFGHTPVLVVHQFSPCHKAISEDRDREALQQALADTAENRHLMILSGKLDRKLKWVKWVVAQSFVTLHACEPLGFWQIEEAAERLTVFTEEEGITLQRGIASRLIEWHGMDFHTLVQEARKLATYTGGQPITPGDLEPFDHAGHSLFDAMEAWVRTPAHRPEQRWQTLAQALRTQHPVPILALLQRFVGDIYQLKALAAQGLSPDAIATHSGQKPFRIKKQLGTYQQTPLARLQQLKAALTQAEFAIKTGRQDGRLALELLWAL